jgi:type VI secretion system secreted protein Hcp
MATRIFLTINATTPIPGETTDPGGNTIEIQSFSWGVQNETTIGSASGGAGAGKAKLQPLVVVKRPDKASNTLFQAVATGDHFASASLQVVTQGSPTLRYDFTLVFVAGLVTQGSQGETPLEEVTFAYGAVALR